MILGAENEIGYEALTRGAVVSSARFFQEITPKLPESKGQAAPRLDQRQRRNAHPSAARRDGRPPEGALDATARLDKETVVKYRGGSSTGAKNRRPRRPTTAPGEASAEVALVCADRKHPPRSRWERTSAAPRFLRCARVAAQAPRRSRPKPTRTRDAAARPPAPPKGARGAARAGNEAPPAETRERATPRARRASGPFSPSETRYVDNKATWLPEVGFALRLTIERRAQLRIAPTARESRARRLVRVEDEGDRTWRSRTCVELPEGRGSRKSG